MAIATIDTTAVVNNSDCNHSSIVTGMILHSSTDCSYRIAEVQSRFIAASGLLHILNWGFGSNTINIIVIDVFPILSFFLPPLHPWT